MNSSVKKALTAVAVGSTIAVAGIASPAQAASSGPCWGAPTRTCYPTMAKAWIPWTSSWNNNGKQVWTIPKDARVDMQCWTDGVYKEGTAKWFRVKRLAYPFTTGYVPATTVASQITVGRC